VLQARGIARPPQGDATPATEPRLQRSAPRPQVSDSDRQAIQAYLGDFAPELGDTAPLKSSLTRVLHSYEASGFTLSGFIQALHRARSRTKERLPSIRSYNKRFAYFLALLDEECGLREPPPEIAAAAKRQAEEAAEEPPRKSLAGRWSHVVRR
jgi:hypothetical protein